MNFIKYIIIASLMQWSGSILAQTNISSPIELTLEDAIQIAIENNDDINIQRQEILLSQNSVTKANAGMLPKVDAVGLASYTNNFTDLELRTFQPEPPIININESAVETATVSLGVEANYVLWDGGAGKYRYQLLQGLSAIEKAKQEVIINSIVTATSSLYYEILKLQNQEALILENIEVTKERIRKIEDKAEFGKANKLDKLQAETTLNQDLTALDNINLFKANLLIDFQDLIQTETEQQYTLAPLEIDFSIPNKNEVEQSIRANNPQIKLTNQGIFLAALNVELADAATKPTLVSFAEAGYFWQKNDVQQLARIRNIGGTIGVSARYNLFDGGVNKTKIQNAKISKEIEMMKIQQLEDDLINSAKKEIVNMRLIQSLLVREETNLQTYQENYDKVNERYRLGKLPEITLREAQLALTSSKLHTANLKVDFMSSKTRLLQLMGQ